MKTIFGVKDISSPEFQFFYDFFAEEADAQDVADKYKQDGNIVKVLATRLYKAGEFKKLNPIFRN